MSLNIEKIDNDGCQWYKIDGVHYGTGFEFDESIYAETEDGAILDCDGCPLTPGDFEQIAVSDAIESIKK